MVITFDPTIESGMTLRWFASESAALRNDPSLSASRHGVMIHDTKVDPELLALANEVADALTVSSEKGDAVARPLVTHRRTGPFFREQLEAIEVTEVPAAA
jgi:hypothetical protein